MTHLEQVTIDGEQFYQLRDSDRMRPFFMSIVSDGNHWMFVSSNGGLTAGRRNAEYALFPYYTDDKLTEAAETTGSKTVCRVTTADGATAVWEPFSLRDGDRYDRQRNLYKSVRGNQLIFEEVNRTLGLTFRYRWSSSDTYGFLRTATLRNDGDAPRTIELLDGLQNVLPYGVGSELQMRSSNLADAYKRNELHAESGLGIYALSAIIVDKAEPSEALKANVVWSQGLDAITHLLSPRQIDVFRRGEELTAERDTKGRKGAYLLHARLELAAGSERSWHLVANVNQSRPDVARLIQELRQPDQLVDRVHEDVRAGTQRLVALTAAADGLQRTADRRRDSRHFSNVMFNIMRGGIFDDNYRIEGSDFLPYLRHANAGVYDRHREAITQLGADFQLSDLQQLAQRTEDVDFHRLLIEYLPLKFSRRHGDPSRPWNKFSINTRHEDGSKILDYEGNWRDIFQNWEALAHSYPDFMTGMIFKFLNASTFDGYNPYRVTKGGFDWETIEPDNPWSYIGYWGDHQIIYLLKFLEFSERYEPGKLLTYLGRRLFTYANVPYRIAAYTDTLADPKNTVDFDAAADERIRERRDDMGADGALLTDRSGELYHVSMVEKLLATLLAKVANFIPEGGIWMNTQRPEWNDANNALVGNGVSMVTLYYLRRFTGFLPTLLDQAGDGAGYPVSRELATLFRRTVDTLREHHGLLGGPISDRDRKRVLDALGQATTDFRATIYDRSFSGETEEVTVEELRTFAELAQDYFDHTIRANRRDDELYHAYNLMTPTENGVAISYLDEMLEGQVAVLSAGFLSPTEALAVMDGLKNSALFREDQYSYILYPNKDLPGFLEKNNIPADGVEASPLLRRLIADGDGRIVQQDVNGEYHFNGNFTNVKSLNAALDALTDTPYAEQAKQERQSLQQLFERVFNHKEFTGRSGTFFGYEGLGSIYWHMVSKLQLAVQECYLDAVARGADAETTGRMLEHYYEIVEGTGVHKDPELYGAFPTDPYSHTPTGKGAQQPGMTGQVKEDILSRFGELGLEVTDGRLSFRPSLLREDEFLTEAGDYEVVGLDDTPRTLRLEAGSLGFTYCQTPVVYTIGETAGLTVVRTDGGKTTTEGTRLSAEDSRAVFGRAGTIDRILVTHPTTVLR